MNSPIPFIYGRPVRPKEFINREADLRTIFNRLRNTESTAVVGEPHIGKSSLLLKLADQDTQRAYLGDEAQHWVFSSRDLQAISNDYEPPAFWKDALEPLHGLNAAISRRWQQAAQENYARHPLEQLFSHLGNSQQQLVLLLDEFDRLLAHSNFQDPAFFGLLRSLATRTGGLALVMATRPSVAEMNERGRGLLDTGSPFFNHMIERRLRPFDEPAINALLSQAGDALSPDDRRFICRVTGCHPFLLQAMAATWLEISGDDRQALAAERFYEQISFHFDDLWRTLDDNSRTTAVILSLVELGGRALGQDFAFGEIEQVDKFGPELRKLAERGLARQVKEGWQFDWQHLLLWRGERWTVGAQAFAWWVRDVVIGKTRTVPTVEDWLTNTRYHLLLTQGQWDRLIGTLHKAPQWALHGVAGLARALFEELVRKT